MAYYDHKCQLCGKVFEIKRSMAEFDGTEKIICKCGGNAVQYFSSKKLTGIITTSSPSRG